jgi:hypothetical protein
MQYSPISLLRKSVRGEMVPSKRIRDLAAKPYEQRKLSHSDCGRTVQLRTRWLGKGMSWLADLLQPRLVQSHPTVIIPLYKRLVFVRLLNCTEFSSRLSEISQTLDAITGIQFRVGSMGRDERWPLGSVCVSSRSSV